MLPGLLTALHIKFDHPTVFQLKQLFTRYFFAINLDKHLQETTDTCHTCATLRTTPKFAPHQSTSAPPESIGISFAGDVIKRNRQLILLIRETVTSYTFTCLIDSEEHDSLREGLISLIVGACSLDGPSAVVRVDPAPGYIKIINDDYLLQNNITLEVGRTKNINKNPVAEKAIRELEDELLRQNPNNNLITPSMLSIATARLNSRIRNQGLY